MNKKRIGVFDVDLRFLEDESIIDALYQIKAVIIRAENMLWRNVIEYTACSPFFEEVKDGEYPHRYQLIMSESGEIVVKKVA